MDLETFIHNLFLQEPKSPCTYNVALPVNYKGSMFKILFYILISGAKILYGENITPDDITSSQFVTLNKYMSSIGHQIEYNYTYHNDIPVLLNIWFKKIEKPLTICKINSFN